MKKYRIIFDSNLKQNPLFKLYNDINTKQAQKEEIERRQNELNKNQIGSFKILSNKANEESFLRVVENSFIKQFEDYINSGNPIDTNSIEYMIYRKIKWQRVFNT